MRPKLKGAETAVFAVIRDLDESQPRALRGLYEGRLRSRQEEVEGIKRKWEEFTGQPVPKRLRTDEFQIDTAAAKKTAAVTKPPPAKPVAATKPVAIKLVNEPLSEPAKAGIDPPPEENVASMAYNDIRKELKRRGISCVGKKTELIDRLVNAMKKDKTMETSVNTKEALGSAKTDVIMEDAEEEGEKEKANKADKMANKENAKAVVEKVKPSPARNAISKPSPVRSALKPSKFGYKTTACPAVTQVAATHEVMREAPTVTKPLLKAKETTTAQPKLQSVKEPTPKDATNLPPKESIPCSKTSSESESSKSNASFTAPVALKPTSVVMQTTPRFKSASNVNSAAKSATGNSAVKLSETKKHLSAIKENRAAKLAEMRERVKKTTVGSATKTSSSTTNVASTSVKMTAIKSSTTATIENKTTPSLIVKMREKAAAEKAGAPSMHVKPNNPTLKSTGSIASIKSNVSLKSGSPPKPHQVLKTNALKQLIDPANKAPPKKLESKPLSPMQTYEMSDREEESSSDEDSDDDSRNNRPKKSIPDWALRANLQRALTLQFINGPGRLDPDKIFGEVETCDLEQIFGDIKSKKRYHKRTSSGNWAKDHVTIAEKLAYKRTMGYNHS